MSELKSTVQCAGCFGSCRRIPAIRLRPSDIARLFIHRNIRPVKMWGCRLLFAAAANGTDRAIIRAAGGTDSRRVATRGGKSGLHRAGCRLTAGCGNATESGTESQTADGRGNPNQVRVKRCGKSAPRNWQQLAAGKTPSAARPNRTH